MQSCMSLVSRPWVCGGLQFGKKTKMWTVSDLNTIRGQYSGERFTVGLVWGLIVGLALVLAPMVWLALLPFVAVLIIYLQQLLAAPPPDIDSVLRHAQLLDLCANLYFGIAVLWTAIGICHAWLYALGDPAVATKDAFAMLQRLVDGGILLVLSATIVGGIGGYLMRAVTSLCVGRAMNALYTRTVRQPQEENPVALGRVEGA